MDLDSTKFDELMDMLRWGKIELEALYQLRNMIKLHIGLLENLDPKLEGLSLKLHEYRNLRGETFKYFWKNRVELEKKPSPTRSREAKALRGIIYKIYCERIHNALDNIYI